VRTNPLQTGGIIQYDRNNQNNKVLTVCKITLPVRLAALLIGLLASVASAQSLPPGPYSSWSRQQQQQAANSLKEICAKVCEPYTAAAKAGGMRASYEAAACTSACFYNRLPKDYPGLAAIKQSAEENYAQAKKLGSNAPVFLGGK
jgi:hypothetical protein